MNIHINHRGNGMCPTCIYWSDCSFHAALTDTLAKTRKKKQSDMELVIYSCPHYKKKK